MIRGFIAGAFWGAILGALALVMTSQMAVWRDLTPPVTGTEIAEERLPDVIPDPSDGAQDAPVVTAGTGTVQPASPGLPSVATETAPAIAAPLVDTASTGAPSLASLPGTVDAPTAPEVVAGSVDITAIEASPNLASAGEAVEPPATADTAPQSTDVLTALTPSRFAPKPQTGVADLPAPGESADAPDMVADVTDAPDLAPQSTALAALDALPQPAPPPPSAPEQPVGLSAPDEELSLPAEIATLPGAPATDEVAEVSAPAPSLPKVSALEPAPASVDVGPAQLPSSEAPVLAAAPDQPAAPESVGVAGLAPEAAPSAPSAPGAPVALQAAQGESAPDVPASPTSPEAGDSPDLETEIATADQPTVPVPVADTAPERDEGSDRIAQAEPDTAPVEAAAVPEPAPAAAERTLPRITRVGSDTGASLPGKRIGRLPRIGDDATDAPDEDQPVDVAARVEPGEDAPALVRNAIEFAGRDDAALLSIVLIHETGALIEPLPVPMTFAVPASAPDAAEVAMAYREAGHEVALIPDLPKGARAQDVQVALDVNLDEIPGAVALIDATGDGFQANRDAVAQIVTAASGTGHGVVTRSQGLDSAGRLAEREGVAAARIYGALEAEETDRAAIGRALDRAAFRARSDGRLILSGTASPGQLAGILAWALENRDGDVALAPLSAVLQPAE